MTALHACALLLLRRRRGRCRRKCKPRVVGSQAQAQGGRGAEGRRSIGADGETLGAERARERAVLGDRRALKSLWQYDVRSCAVSEVRRSQRGKEVCSR